MKSKLRLRELNGGFIDSTHFFAHMTYLQSLYSRSHLFISLKVCSLCSIQGKCPDLSIITNFEFGK